MNSPTTAMALGSKERVYLDDGGCNGYSICLDINPLATTEGVHSGYVDDRIYEASLRV